MTPPKDFTADLPLRRVGRYLRQWRLRSELTGMEVANSVAGLTQSRLSRMETASQKIDPELVMFLGVFYGVPREERRWVVRLARSSRWSTSADEDGTVPPYRDVWRERQAEYWEWLPWVSEVRVMASGSIPALLRTEDYAVAVASERAPLRSEMITRAEMAERTREAVTLLTAPPVVHRPWLSVVLAESALRPLVGGVGVMREQLAHLIELAGWKSVTIEVVPFTARGHLAEGASFELLTYGRTFLPPLVYQEGVTDADFVDDPKMIADYEQRFDDARRAALPPQESVDFIAGLVDEL